MEIGAAQAQAPRTGKTISLAIAGEPAAAERAIPKSCACSWRPAPIQPGRQQGRIAAGACAAARFFRDGKPSRTGRRPLKRALVTLPVRPRRPGRDHHAYPSKWDGGSFYSFPRFPSRMSPTHVRPATTVGNPIVEVSRIRACRILSGVAPASRALLAWLWTDPSDRMAVAAASWTSWAVFSPMGPAWFTVPPGFSAAPRYSPPRPL